MENAIKALEIKSLGDLDIFKLDAETVKAELDEMLPDVKNLVVTEENLKDVKEISKSIGRTAKELDEYRKAPQRLFKALSENYNNVAKEAVQYVTEKKQILDGKIDYFDEQVREEHRTHAEQCIQDCINEMKLEERFSCHLHVKPEYSNLSYSLNKIEKDIRDTAAMLKMKQDTYKLQVSSVERILEAENRDIANKLELEPYLQMVYKSVDEMGDVNEIFEKIKADAQNERIREENVRKAAEEKARREAEERERRISEEAQRRAEEQVREAQRQLEAERLERMKAEIAQNAPVEPEITPEEQEIEDLGGFEDCDDAVSTDLKEKYTRMLEVTCTIEEFEQIAIYLQNMGVDFQIITPEEEF